METLFFQKNPLQDLLSILNAVISTNESTKFIIGHMIYNLAYTYILQTTTTVNPLQDCGNHPIFRKYYLSIEDFSNQLISKQF